MESRRARLITKGYLAGWLDLEYKNPLSELREEYILSELERQEVDRVLHHRTLVETNVLANIKTSESIKLASEMVSGYGAFVLPYLYGNDKMEGNKLSEKELSDVKALHAKNKELFARIAQTRENKKDGE